jgi:hypothetical protein
MPHFAHLYLNHCIYSNFKTTFVVLRLYHIKKDITAPASPTKKDNNIKFIIEVIMFNATSKDNKTPVVRGIVAAEIAVPAIISICHIFYYLSIIN